MNLFFLCFFKDLNHAFTKATTQGQAIKKWDVRLKKEIRLKSIHIKIKIKVTC